MTGPWWIPQTVADMQDCDGKTILVFSSVVTCFSVLHAGKNSLTFTLF